MDGTSRVTFREKSHFVDTNWATNTRHLWNLEFELKRLNDHITFNFHFLRIKNSTLKSYNLLIKITSPILRVLIIKKYACHHLGRPFKLMARMHLNFCEHPQSVRKPVVCWHFERHYSSSFSFPFLYLVSPSNSKVVKLKCKCGISKEKEKTTRIMMHWEHASLFVNLHSPYSPFASF